MSTPETPLPGADGGLPEELRRAGEAVSRLERPAPPPGLAARTVARLRASVVRRRSWLFRPITHPLARVAALLLLLLSLVFLTHPATAERIGRALENALGPRATTNLEKLVDHVLAAYGPVQLGPEDMADIPSGGPIPRGVHRPSLPPGQRPENPSTFLRADQDVA